MSHKGRADSIKYETVYCNVRSGKNRFVGFRMISAIECHDRMPMHVSNKAEYKPCILVHRFHYRQLQSTRKYQPDPG